MYSALSTLNTTTEVPLSKAPNPQLLPGRRSINACPLLWVCIHGVCVCVFTAVCVHLWWDKCRALIPSMGYHTWPHITFTFNQFWYCNSLKYPTQRNGFQQQMLFKLYLICSVVGDRPGPHCQSFLHHPRVHNDLQPAAEAYTEWDRALQGVLALLWVQKHQRQRGMCLILLNQLKHLNKTLLSVSNQHGCNVLLNRKKNWSFRNCLRESLFQWRKALKNPVQR